MQSKRTTGAVDKGTTSSMARSKGGGVLEPAGAEPCEAVGRRFRVERKPALTHVRIRGGELAYWVLWAARFCLLVFSR